MDKEERPRALVTGGAGFLGSHLCERLLAEGYLVVCVDNLVTGTRENVVHLERDPGFEYVEHDVTSSLHIEGRLDEVYHFASPASPKDFGRLPIEILRVGSLGTQNALDVALEGGARFMLASSSEVYGDPLVHPQHEDYRGNVSTVGPRACYDEGKRCGETLCYDYVRQHGVSVRVAGAERDGKTVASSARVVSARAATRCGLRSWTYSSSASTKSPNGTSLSSSDAEPESTSCPRA